MLNNNFKASIASVFVFKIILLFSIAAPPAAFAQDASSSPTPSQEELQLQEQKRLIELQRDIELAKKAIRDAQPQPTPKPSPAEPTATPLAGDATLSEGVRLETEMVSYKAMAEAAQTLVWDIDSKQLSIKSLAIYDAQIVKDWRLYQALFPAFKAQVEDILTQYKDKLCPEHSGVDANFRKTYCEDKNLTALSMGERVRTENFSADAVTNALGIGGSLIKSFIDLAALFRTETKIEGKSVTIDQNALVAEVFRRFKSTHTSIKLYYPAVFPPRIHLSHKVDGKLSTVELVGLLYIFKSEADRLIKSQEERKKVLANKIKDKLQQKQEMQNDLPQVKKLKQQLANINAALGLESVWIFRKKLWEEKVEIEGKLAKLPSQSDLEEGIKKLTAEIKPTQDQIDVIDENIDILTKLNERFQAFVDDSIKVDANGMNALALFIKSEDIDNAMKDDASYWLEIKSVSAGGNNRTRKNLIWFFAGARVDHSGGVILEYTLYDKSGGVVWSDKLSHYDGYIKPKDIRSEEFRDPLP